jgi:predicted dienelactone hydrolase
MVLSKIKGKQQSIASKPISCRLNRRVLLSQKALGWCCGLGVLSVLAATPAAAAEVISIRYGSLEGAVSLDEVVRFVETGTLSGELAGYGSFIPLEQQSRLRQLLQKRANVSATLVSQLVYSPVGDIVLGRLAALINGGERDQAGTALRAAVVQAAASNDGLTLLNLLKEFPLPEVQVDASLALEMMGAIAQRSAENQQLVSLVEAQAAEQVSLHRTPAPEHWANLSQPGSYKWQKVAYDWVDGSRRSHDGQVLGRSVPTDLYFPESQSAMPMVVISHGMASNRQTLAYLAEHLASHGIAVAIPEHVGSNGTKFQRYFDGVAAPPEAREALDRPLDVSFILDQLAAARGRDGRIPPQLGLERTVVVGQSFGGYTALALGGAQLNGAALQQACGKKSPQDLLNMSLLLQCQLTELGEAKVPLRDERVVAVVAANPFVSRVFNRAGIAAVDVPVMMVAGSADLVVPPGEEQFYPFTWLPKGSRYLALMRNGTHFSVLQETKADLESIPIAPSFLGAHGEIAQDYLAALSLAFVRRYGGEDLAYDAYLTPGYGQALSRAEMPLSLVRSLDLKTPESSARP